MFLLHIYIYMYIYIYVTANQMDIYIYIISMDAKIVGTNLLRQKQAHSRSEGPPRNATKKRSTNAQLR